MADFYGALSSTSFRVKDREKWLADPDVQWIQHYAKTEQGFFEEGSKDGGKPGYWAFGWYGQYPSCVLTRWNDERNEDDELDIAEVVRYHIRPGDVCQIGVSGNEKLRYIGGTVVWITTTGITYFDATTAWDTVISPGRLKKTVLTFQREITKITRKAR